MAHQHQQNKQNFPFVLDALYCEEEHWEENDKEDCFINEQESQNVNDNIETKPMFLLEQDLLWEEEQLSSLLTKEKENEVYNITGLERNNPCLAESRKEAVEWMLKVTAFYSFSSTTAVLAVNYLDRFFFSFQSHNEKKPWMTQLAAVACLSLAAKVEEPQVPLLLDFQVEESEYVFEAKTIQRMEMLVLSTLQWRMNPVTPLSFLDFITRRLGLKNHVSWEFLRRCECLLLFIISDCRFMCHLPSIMATATMLHVVTSLEPCLGAEFGEKLLSILGINKDKLEDCYRLISEVASTFHFHSSNKRKFSRSVPGSPKGVMDLSFSCDSSSDSWPLAAAAIASVSSSPEPLSKKRRAQQTGTG